MSDIYLFRNTLRDLIRPGKLTAAVLLVGLAVLFGILARANVKPAEFSPAETYNGISARLVFGFILVILSVVFATDLIVQEMEQKTIPYLLTRPIPRWRILLVKFLASVFVTTAIVWIADIGVALSVFGIGQIGHSRLWQDMLILPIGALAYSAVFLLLATIFSKPLLFGLAYAFGWESWTPYLPGDWQKISLMSYLHALAPHLDTTNSTILDQVLAPTGIPIWLAWTVLTTVIISGMFGAMLVFSFNEYTPREETT